MHIKTVEERNEMYKQLESYVENVWLSNEHHFTENLEIPVKEAAWDWYNEYFDIWEKSEMHHRMDLITKYSGRATPLWGASVGLKTTAELLWLYKDDKKMLSFVWIAALLWTAMKEGKWKGETYQFVRDLYYQLSADALPFRWHHATKTAIPIDFHLRESSEDFSEKFTPNTVENIVHWAMMEWDLFNKKYILVKLEEKK